MVRCAVSTKLVDHGAVDGEGHGRVQRVGPAREGAELRAAAARSAGLWNRVPSQARTWSAPTTTRPGRRRRHGPGLGLGEPPGQGLAAARPGACRLHRALVDPGALGLDGEARRSRGARAGSRWWRRGGGAGPRARARRAAGGSGRSRGDELQAVLAVAGRGSRPPSPRSSGGSRRWSASGAWRRAGAQAAISSATALAVDVERGIVGLEAEEPVLADLHDALRAGDQPDDERLARRLERRRQRHARHQREVGGLQAAIGEVDRGRRLRGAADAHAGSRRPRPGRRAGCRRRGPA